MCCAKITNRKISKLQKGDELAPGVIKLVKGLHRHEGASSRSVTRWAGTPREQGRHRAAILARRRHAVIWPDGKPCEIVLKPAGVPSRMNVRSDFSKTHLGWAAHEPPARQGCRNRKGRTQDANAIREVFKERFGGNCRSASSCLKLDDEAGKARRPRHGEGGIWFWQPRSFDGRARKTEIKAVCLLQPGFPQLQAKYARSFDGMTGEEFRTAGDRGLQSTCSSSRISG